MRLSRLELENVGPFRSVDLVVPSTGVLLIVGPNNAGKSTLLRAFGSIAGAAALPERSWSALPTTNYNLRASFALSPEERAEVLNEDVLNSPVLSRIEAWRHDGSIVFHGSDGNGSMRPAEYLPSPFGGALQQLERRWREQLFLFAVHRPGAEAKVGLTAQPRLQPNGSNLPQVLVHLKLNDEPRWLELGRLIKSLVPSAGELAVRADHSHLEIGFHKGKRFTNIKDVGTGIEQLLLSCVAGTISERNAVIICEEPEAHLHPAAQRAWLDRVHEWATERLFIIATHSPVFLDHPTVSAVWAVEGTEDGTSSVEPVDRNRRSRPLELLGVRLSDVLASERVLLVESVEDAAVLSTWFPEWFASQRVVPVPALGRALSGQMDRVRSVFEGADALPRNVRMLRDRDEMTNAEVDRAIPNGVFALPCRELENLMLDPDAIANLLRTKGVPEVPSSEQLARALRDAADELRPLVAAKRVLAPLLSRLRKSQRKAEDRLAPTGFTGPAGALENAFADLSEPLKNAIGSLESALQSTELALASEWETDWKSVAPGSDVLEKVFTRYGTTFSKSVDGPKLAEFLATRPPLQALLDRIAASFDASDRDT